MLRGSIAPGDDQGDADSGTMAGNAPPPSTTGEQRPSQSQGGLSSLPDQNAPDQGPENNTGSEAEEQPSNQGGPLGGLGDILPELPENAAAPEPLPGITTQEGLPAEPVAAETAGGSVRHEIVAPQPHDLDPYVPIGIRLGSFILFPQMETGGIFIDNVLGTKNNTIPDQALEVKPDLLLQSDWARNFFSIDLNADRSWYAEEPTQDDKDYQILLKGRLDVTDQTHLGSEVEKSQTQVGRESVSLTDLIGETVNLHEEHVTGYADHTFNRLTLKLTGTVADYNYDDFPLVPTTGGLPLTDIRDYREDEGTLRASYELQPGKTVFLEGSLNQQDYAQNIFADGIVRDSNGIVLLSGLTLDLPIGITGEVSAGWGEQQSVEGSVAPIEGPLFNADLIWLPEPMTKLEFIARSEIDVTTLTDSFGTIDRYYELSLQHAFWRYLVLGVYASYEMANYVESPQLDQRTKEGFTGEYYFNPTLSVYSRYEHTHFFSTVSEDDFSDNEVWVGIKLRR